MSEPNDANFNPKPASGTNALRMLDHLMLWLARLYAVLALGFSLFRFISFSRDPETAVITYSPKGVGMTGNSTTLITHHATTTLFIGTLLLACLAFGLFMLNWKFGQRIVIAAALGSLALNFYGVLHLLYLSLLSNSPVSTYMHHPWFWEVFVGSTCNLVIQLGNIWLALRHPISDGPGESHLPPLSSAQSI
jgi:hypothetical protein